MELSIFPLNFSIFCRTFRSSVENSDFLWNFQIFCGTCENFRGKFDSSMEVCNFRSKMPAFDGSFGFSAEVWDFLRNGVRPGNWRVCLTSLVRADQRVSFSRQQLQTRSAV